MVVVETRYSRLFRNRNSDGCHEAGGNNLLRVKKKKKKKKKLADVMLSAYSFIDKK